MVTSASNLRLQGFLGRVQGAGCRQRELEGFFEMGFGKVPEL